MFERYLIVDGSLRNLVDDGEGTRLTGYALDVRIGYYRGLGLSMVDVALEVDGDTVRPGDITFTVHGTSYPVPTLPGVLDDRWGFTEDATLSVRRTGGLAPGAHTVRLTEHLRISYAASGNGDVLRASKELTIR
jgi:hypothetical protein